MIDQGHCEKLSVTLVTEVSLSNLEGAEPQI
jgi:hypothetical protein